MFFCKNTTKKSMQEFCPYLSNDIENPLPNHLEQKKQTWTQLKPSFPLKTSFWTQWTKIKKISWKITTFWPLTWRNITYILKLKRKVDIVILTYFRVFFTLEFWAFSWIARNNSAQIFSISRIHIYQKTCLGFPTISEWISFC